jgi:hypothetical protein
MVVVSTKGARLAPETALFQGPLFWAKVGHAAFAGGNGIKFVKQYYEYGLKGRFLAHFHAGLP